MPTDNEISKCLRRIVVQQWDAEGDLPISHVRDQAEETLGLDKGYLNSDPGWRAKSKTIILAAAEALSPVLEKSTQPVETHIQNIGHQGHCLLLELPLEIQIMIFKRAFITSEIILRTISVIGWAEDEAESAETEIRDLQHGMLWAFPNISKFPKLQVEKFLVSKAFFETAAKAYVENQWIDLSASRVFSGRTIAEQPRSILCRWARFIYISASWSVHANVLRSDVFGALKWLEVEVNPCHFYCHEDRYDLPEEAGMMREDVWRTILGDEQIAWSDIALDLGGIRGLNGIKLSSAPNKELGAFTLTQQGNLHVTRDLESFNPAETSIWQSNLQKLEEIVKQQVTKSRTSDEAKPHWRTEPTDWDYHCFGRELTIERYVNDTRKAWA